MPRSGPQLAEEGRIREDWEYAEWASRVSRDAEDMRYSTTEDKWRIHVLGKYNFSPDVDKRESQLNALWNKGMLRTWEEMPAVGITPSTRYTPTGYYLQYKDVATGRFVKATEVFRRMGY